MFSKADDNPIVVRQGFLKCITIPHQHGDGKKNPLCAGVKFRDSRKSRKFAGNSEFPGYFEAALYHSPQDIHKAWTTPRTASEDPFQTIQEPLLLECWRCFQSPWRHPETVKNSGSKQSKREPHTQKMESELDILSSPPEPVNILYDFVFFLYYLTRTPFTHLVYSFTLVCTNVFFELPGDSFTTSWPEIGTIRTLPNPHCGWSRSLSSAYNSSFCSSPEDDWPMAQGLLPMWSRKKFGGPDTPQRHILLRPPLGWLGVADGVPWRKHKSLQYDEVQPVMNSNFLSVFGPLTMYSCSPCSFTFGSVFRIRIRKNSWELMKIHDTKPSRLWLTRSALDRKMAQNLIINIKQKLEDTNYDTSQTSEFSTSPNLDLQIFTSTP